MNVAMSVGLAMAAILGACLLVLWFASAGVIEQHENRLAGHDDQLATLAYQMPALLEFLGIEIPAPVVDDSPAALEGDDCPTDEIPVLPATEPDGIAIQVQSALIEQRPSPVPRGKSAEWVEEAIKGFNFTGRDR